MATPRAQIMARILAMILAYLTNGIMTQLRRDVDAV